VACWYRDGSDANARSPGSPGSPVGHRKPFGWEYVALDVLWNFGCSDLHWMPIRALRIQNLITVRAMQMGWGRPKLLGYSQVPNCSSDL